MHLHYHCEYLVAEKKRNVYAFYNYYCLFCSFLKVLDAAELEFQLTGQVFLLWLNSRITDFSAKGCPEQFIIPVTPQVRWPHQVHSKAKYLNFKHINLIDKHEIVLGY